MVKVGQHNFDADFLPTRKPQSFNGIMFICRRNMFTSPNPSVPLQSIRDVRSISPRRPEFPTSLFDTGGAGNLTEQGSGIGGASFANHRLFWDVLNSNLIVVNSYSFWFFSFPARSITSNLPLTLQTTKHGPSGFPCLDPFRCLIFTFTKIELLYRIECFEH